MNKSQLIAIIACALLAAYLFYRGMLGSTSDLSQRKSMPAQTQNMEALTEETFFENSLKAVDTSIAQMLRTIKIDSEKSRNSQQKTALLSKAGSICDSLSLLGLTGLFAEKVATIKNTATAWVFVSNRYTNAVQFSQIPTERLFLINKGKEAARKALSFEPDNLDAQNLLAQCIINQSDDSIMTVIPILKGIEAKDSNNIAAIYQLAMLSVKSGQTDKAIMRFRKLIKLEPMTPENYYQLAELLATAGNKKEATQMLETCKSLVKSPEQIKVINEKIKEINN